MRALKIIGLVIAGLVAGVALGLVLGLPVMWLWNWLMPAIFGLPIITFWQAVGLLVLSHMLFKSHAPGHHQRHERKDRARWDSFAKHVKGAMDQESRQTTTPEAP
jgi:high-affinity Fe2+/Pb2+ permease